MTRPTQHRVRTACPCGCGGRYERPAPERRPIDKTGEAIVLAAFLILRTAIDLRATLRSTP